MDDTDAEDALFALYADWLMEQPEACICNGDMLVARMESGWGVDQFIAQLPEQTRRAAEKFFNG